MAGNLQQRLDRLKAKAILLADGHAAACTRLGQAQERINELEARIAVLEQELRLKDAAIEQLKVVSVLTPDHRDVEATRQFLSGLVRDIDKCIAQLSI